MKVHQILLPLAAAIILAACGSRGTAQSVLGQSEGILNGMREQAATTAPEELKAAEATLAHMKQSFDEREYKAVVDDTPKFNAQVKTLYDAMAAGQSANAVAAQEWSALNAQVPQSIEAIQARVDSLKPTALPKDITRKELETAKSELEILKARWEEATMAASAGNPVEATDKGRIVQAKAEELKNSLGMNETLASTG
jgi:SMC interacting uncharacterized protein involved in chromosome segregation